MQLSEIKNDIAKILYTTSESNLLLADFLLIEDINQSLIAQIIDIESTEQSDTNVATVKFALSINKNASLSTYNGYTPSKDANIIHIDSKEISQLVQSNGTNIYWGCLASHPETEINLGISLLRERPYIQCDKIENATTIATNILYSLRDKHKRTIIIDFDGRYKRIEDATRLTVSKEYKLPLNFQAFDFIAENDLGDCSAENKAIIEGILLELQSYVDTLEEKFIPFDIFKSVIDEQCRQNPIPELIIFKNKLIKYQQKSLFAQDKSQFDFLDKILSKTSITIIDASGIDEKWHRFIIETLASQIDKKCYFLVNLDDTNSKKSTLNALYENENVRPIPLSSYKYSLLTQLKAYCKNLILFAPIEQTNDFEIYNSFLRKLNQKEFIIWSENTFFMPLIVKLKAFDSATLGAVDEEIKKDVDEMFTIKNPEPSVIAFEELPIIEEETTTQYVEKELEEPAEIEQEILEENKTYTPENEIQEELDYDVLPQQEIITNQENQLIQEEDEQDELFEITEEEPEEEAKPIIDDITDDDLDFLDSASIIKEDELVQQEIMPEEAITSDHVTIVNNQMEEQPVITRLKEASIPQNIDIDNDDDVDDDEAYVVQPESTLQQTIIQGNKEIRQSQTIAPVEEKTMATVLTEQNSKEEASITTPPKPPEQKPLPKKPTVPIYEAKVADIPIIDTPFKEGNFVYHAKYGKGVVEKIITYGNKTLCSIQFDNVGRRLLDPNLANIQLV